MTYPCITPARTVDEIHTLLSAFTVGKSFGKTCRGSSDEPSPFVDIELHQAFVSHFQ